MDGLSRGMGVMPMPEASDNIGYGIAKEATAMPPDQRLIIEAVPGGFILTEHWGKQSVCSTVGKVVSAVRAKYGPAKTE